MGQLILQVKNERVIEGHLVTVTAEDDEPAVVHDAGVTVSWERHHAREPLASGRGDVQARLLALVGRASGNRVSLLDAGLLEAHPLVLLLALPQGGPEVLEAAGVDLLDRSRVHHLDADRVIQKLALEAVDILALLLLHLAELVLQSSAEADLHVLRPDGSLLLDELGTGDGALELRFDLSARGELPHAHLLGRELLGLREERWLAAPLDEPIWRYTPAGEAVHTAAVGRLRVLEAVAVVTLAVVRFGAPRELRDALTTAADAQEALAPAAGRRSLAEVRVRGVMAQTRVPPGGRRAPPDRAVAGAAAERPGWLD